jgi:hypothetical protein
MPTPSARQMLRSESRLLSRRWISARCSAETEALLKLQDELAPAGFAPMVLLSVVKVAVLFVVRRSALGATVSYHDGEPIDR